MAHRARGRPAGSRALDHVLRSPSGMGFVIETKTLRYSRTHVLRTVDAARWLARRRRRYPRGVLPVVCVTRARRVERYEDEALVVSLDRLITALRQTRSRHGRPSSTPRSQGSARRRPPSDDRIEEAPLNCPRIGAGVRCARLTPHAC